MFPLEKIEFKEVKVLGDYREIVGSARFVAKILSDLSEYYDEYAKDQIRRQIWDMLYGDLVEEVYALRCRFSDHVSWFDKLSRMLEYKGVS